MAFTDCLWGGRLTTVKLDPVRHECTLRIDVLRDGVDSTHELLCRGVTELRFFNEIPAPWSHAEVTEVAADVDSIEGGWRLEVMLWSEQAELTLRCVEVSLDGEPQTHP